VRRERAAVGLQTIPAAADPEQRQALLFSVYAVATGAGAEPHVSANNIGTGPQCEYLATWEDTGAVSIGWYDASSTVAQSRPRGEQFAAANLGEEYDPTIEVVEIRMVDDGTATAFALGGFMFADGVEDESPSTTFSLTDYGAGDRQYEPDHMGHSAIAQWSAVGLANALLYHSRQVWAVPV